MGTAQPEEALQQNPHQPGGRPRPTPEPRQEEAARLTMSTQACFPSMKPLGMELGVRISYLKEDREARSSGFHPARPAHTWDQGQPQARQAWDSAHKFYGKRARTVPFWSFPGRRT